MMQTVADIIKTRKSTVLLWGEDGAGKTSLLKSLKLLPKEILFIAADPGQMALKPIPLEVVKKRGQPEFLTKDLTGVAFFQPKTPEDFLIVIDLIKQDAGKNWKCIWVDGIDQAGDIILGSRKAIENKKGDKANMMRAYGDMADRMEWWITEIINSAASSVFTTHIEEGEEGDVPYGPSFPGRKMSGKLTQMFDLVLCLRVARKTNLSKPTTLLHCWRGTDTRYKVKDRSGLLDEFEDADLGAILSKVFPS